MREGIEVVGGRDKAGAAILNTGGVEKLSGRRIVDIIQLLRRMILT